MTPHRDNLIDIVDDNTACRFGNREKTEARGQGNVVLNCKDEKGTCVKIKLQDVLYIPSLRHRVFLFECLREKNGEFREKKGDSSIILPVSNARIPLSESKGFVWLHEARHGQNEMKEITSKCKVECLDEIRKDEVIPTTEYALGGHETAESSLFDWNEALGHPHPASILFLEQRGLIKVKGIMSFR